MGKHSLQNGIRGRYAKINNSDYFSYYIFNTTLFNSKKTSKSIKDKTIAKVKYYRVQNSLRVCKYCNQ